MKGNMMHLNMADKPDTKRDIPKDCVTVELRP